MAFWRRDERFSEIELAAAVPDALAVLDGDGNLIGWDESEAHAYLRVHSMASECDAECVDRGCVMGC